MTPWNARRRFRNLVRYCATSALACALVLIGAPAGAQCNPSYDPLCGETPGAGPDVGINPDGGNHQFASDGTNVVVPVTIVFTDPDGVNPSTLEVRLWNGGTNVPVSLTSTADRYRLTAKGSIRLLEAGENVLVAQLADSFGNVGFGRATFRMDVAEPGLPIVSPDTHHNEYRNTTLGSFVLPFRVGSYTSAGAERTIELVYNSEHARPSMVIYADARPDPLSGQDVVAMSLRMEAWSAGSTSGPLIRESFYKDGPLLQRLAWRTNTGSRTGAYKYWAVVRSHFADGTYKEKRSVVRGLLINEQTSRYGAGWSVAGIQRIHASAAWSDGVVLNEGDGIARFFTKAACAGLDCAYATPAGDFSRLEYRASSATYLRTYPDGSTVTFSSRGLMTHTSDRFGNTTTVEWQDTQDGKAEPVISRIVDPLGHAVTFAYDASWYLQSITVAGRTMTCSYNASKDLVRIAGPYTLEATYGANHLLASWNTRYGATDPGAVWDIAYDAHSKVASVTAPAVLASGATARPRTRFRSLEAATVVTGAAGTAVSNAAPAVDAAAPLYEIHDPGGHTTRIAFDRYGNPLKIVDDAKTTTMTWTTDGLPAAAESSTWIWSARGELLQHTIDGGVVYEASYDDGLAVYERLSGSATWYQYGPRGELIRSWPGNREDGQRNATTYEYNARYELVRATTPGNRRIEWSYDGNPWRSPDLVRVIGADGATAITRFTYDDWSRLRMIVNALGEPTDRAYDDADRIIRVSDPLWRLTSFEYTGAHQTKVTDAAGKSFHFTYNALGWLVSERHPGSDVSRTYRYDIDGLLIAATDRRGNTVTHSYDAAHRPYDRIADGALTTFRYPDPDRTVVTNGEGSVTTRRIPGVGSLDYVSATLGARRYDIRRFYKPDGTWRDSGVNLEIYLNGVLQSTDSIRYSSDVLPVGSPQPWRFSLQDFTGRTSNIEYDTAGRPAFIHFGNGTTQSNSFDGDGRQQAISFNTAAHATLGGTFTYDVLNRLSGRSSPSGNRLWQYGYDALGQVASYTVANSIPVDCNATLQDCNAGTGPRMNERYTYDAAGNRTDRGAVLEPGTNRYASFSNYKLVYDADGNLIRKSRVGFDQRLTWNSLGQLTGVTTNGVTVSYGYDGLGRRVRRTEGGDTRYFVYDGDDVMLETDASGGILRTYAHWPGTDRPLGVRIGGGAQAPMYYYTMERPGHVTGLLDPAGGAAAQHRYTPFGEVESANDPTGQPLRFMARELDFTAGLYYVRNRWYDPTLARFLSEDPIGIAGGINTYTYAGNDPLNLRDPSGLYPQDSETLPWWETGIFAVWARERAEQDAYEPGAFLRHSVRMGGTGSHVRKPSGVSSTYGLRAADPALSAVCSQPQLDTSTARVASAGRQATTLAGIGAAGEVALNGRADWPPRQNPLAGAGGGRLLGVTFTGGFSLAGGLPSAAQPSTCYTPVSHYSGQGYPRWP